tara:strand:+ start:74855 stop:75904 length:1050 start_codon:yes stop_codon:yes gene_type:complete
MIDVSMPTTHSSPFLTIPLRLLTAATLLLGLGCGNKSTSKTDALPSTSDAQSLLPSNASATALESYVKLFAVEKTPRDHTHPQSLEEIANYIKAEFETFGLSAQLQTYEVNGKMYSNVIATVGPSSAQRIIVGAHYDAAGDLPGADDNASGTAALLELARVLSAERDLPMQVELVAFCLEEPPYFGTPNMGSGKHALSVNPQDVQLMISLEMVGYFTDAPNSQRYPEIPGVPESLLVQQYGSVGNYIAVVGRSEEQQHLTLLEGAMDAANDLDVVSLAVPNGVNHVAWSDHYQYWDRGIPAVMITDTAFYRNEAYHTSEDTWDRLDYASMAQVVDSLRDGLVNLGQAAL